MKSSKQIAILEAMIVVLEEEFRPKKAELSHPDIPIHEFQEALRKHSDEVYALKEKIFALTPENELVEMLSHIDGMLDGTIPVNWGPNPDIGTLALNQIKIRIELHRRKSKRAKISLVAAFILATAFFVARNS